MLVNRQSDQNHAENKDECVLATDHCLVSRLHYRGGHHTGHCECTAQRELPQIKLWLGTGERHPFYEELIQLRTKFPRKMSEEAALAIASKL